MQLSASKIGDLFQCAWQFRPDVERLPDVTNAAAATGTYVHALIDAHLNGVCDAVPITPLADVERGERILDRFREWWDLGHHGDLPWATEVPYAISLTTGEGRVLPSDGQRDYSAASADEVPGTADLVAVDDETVFVDDIKTTLRPEFTTEAPKNKQLLTLGLAASRAHGRPRVVAGLLFANEFEVRRERAEFDVLDLDRHERALRARVASIPNSEPTPGNHCRFCLARIGCPSVPKQFRVKGKAA
jgi:hypothetical protein